MAKSSENPALPATLQQQVGVGRRRGGGGGPMFHARSTCTAKPCKRLVFQWLKELTVPWKAIIFKDFDEAIVEIVEKLKSTSLARDLLIRVLPAEGLALSGKPELTKARILLS